jgi:CBS domain-containing protein
MEGHIMDKQVRDIMTPDPVGVYYDQTITETARLMRDAGVGAVLVVNGESLSGVVTDRDLVVRPKAPARMRRSGRFAARSWSAWTPARTFPRPSG